MTQPVILEPYNPAWQRIYEEERQALVSTLGFYTDGGVLWRIEHIGSTSVPGLLAKPCIDIMLDAVNLPPSTEVVASLKTLGYDYLGEHGLAGRHYFRKGPHAVHLHMLDHDTNHWENYLLFRNYLRANKDASVRYASTKLELAALYPNDRKAYTQGKTDILQTLGQEALAWHLETTAFCPVEALSQELANLTIPWHISSGWALDLYRGHPSRYHDDIDIVIARDDVAALQLYLKDRGWRLYWITEGGKAVFWQDNQLGEAAHQIHAWRGTSFLDVLVEPPVSEGEWVFRKDEQIRLATLDAWLTHKSTPYLAPQIVLLFKAAVRSGGIRSKDQKDFESIADLLSSKQKQWLASSLEQWQGDHPWLSTLRSP